MFENGKLKIRNPEGHLFSTVFAGDICPGDILEINSPEKAAGIMKDIKPFLSQGDLNLVQWETPLASKEDPIMKSGPNLNSTPGTEQIIVQAGFHVALLANNHTGDHGPENVMETIRILKKAGLQTVGAGRNLREANSPLELERAGKKIQIFNFAEHEFGIAGPEKAGTAPIDPVSNLQAVRKAAAECDFVIVVLHGGHEYNPFPSPRMIEFYRALADAGASAVFGCHTHCPEAVEFHNGTPIVYSPGNFYFPKIESRMKVWNTGYLTLCRFDSKGIYEMELLPTRFDRDHVSPLNEEGKKLFFKYMEKLRAPLNDPEKIRALFENWSMKIGYNYLKGSLGCVPEKWYETYTAHDTAASMMHLRNLFTCEAHQDIIRTLLCLIEEGRTEEARGLIDEIEAFQSPEWM